MNSKTQRKECFRRAGRTFLQTACGTLASEILFAVADGGQNADGFRLILTACTASVIAAGIAALMNIKKASRIRHISASGGTE